jgi:hypothetical protein
MKETRLVAVWPTDALLNPRSLAQSVIEGVRAGLVAIAYAQAKVPSILPNSSTYLRLIALPYKDKYQCIYHAIGDVRLLTYESLHVHHC